MKKYLLLLIPMIFLFSCEKDNICIDETTPHLIIRFYDKLHPLKTKQVTNLKVEVEDDDSNIIQIGSNGSRDSIAIPLNVTIDFTKIHLTKNFTDDSVGVEDSFQINYTKEDVFVSRSCGYKTLYHDITTTNLTDNWIQSISLQATDITNESAAHINIFH